MRNLRKPIEKPELVTIIKRENPAPPISQEAKIIRRFIFDATLVVTVKVVGVFAVHRLVKSARDMNKIKFPENWWKEED